MATFEHNEPTVSIRLPTTAVEIVEIVETVDGNAPRVLDPADYELRGGGNRLSRRADGPNPAITWGAVEISYKEPGDDAGPDSHADAVEPPPEAAERLPEPAEQPEPAPAATGAAPASPGRVRLTFIGRKASRRVTGRSGTQYLFVRGTPVEVDEGDVRLIAVDDHSWKVG